MLTVGDVGKILVNIIREGDDPEAEVIKAWNKRAGGKIDGRSKLD